MKPYDCCKSEWKEKLKNAYNLAQEAIRKITFNGKTYTPDGSGAVTLDDPKADDIDLTDGRSVQTAVDAIEDEIGDDDTAGSLRQYADRAVIRVGASSGPSKYNNFPIMTVRFDTNASDNHNANLFFIGKGLDSQMKIVSGNSYPELINTGIIDFLVSTSINDDKTIIELDGYDNTDFTSVKRSATILTVGNGLALTTDGTKTLSNSGVTSIGQLIQKSDIANDIPGSWLVVVNEDYVTGPRLTFPVDSGLTLDENGNVKSDGVNKIFRPSAGIAFNATNDSVEITPTSVTNYYRSDSVLGIRNNYLIIGKSTITSSIECGYSLIITGDDINKALTSWVNRVFSDKIKNDLNGTVFGGILYISPGGLSAYQRVISIEITVGSDVTITQVEADYSVTLYSPINSSRCFAVIAITSYS